MRILSYINTYGRTDTLLPLAILSILNQTHKPDALIIFDENKEFINPLTNPTLKYLLDLSMEKGIQWFWEPGQKRGAHFNHETANLKDYDYNWFLDDDQVAEPNCLEKLLNEMKPDVGAVAGPILKTPTQQLLGWINGTLEDIWRGQNIQWYKWEGKPKECEHLYSSFLYRPNIVHFDSRYSKKSFRAETAFTHSLFLKGYRLIVTPEAITWHFEGVGGCRTPEQEKTNQEMYNDDNFIFNKWLAFKRQNKKLYVIREGLGDHYAFLQGHTLDKNAVYAVCYPELFKGYNTISIGDSEQIIDPKDYKLYDWMEKNNWKGNLRNAYIELYKHIHHENSNK